MDVRVTARWTGLLLALACAGLASAARGGEAAHGGQAAKAAKPASASKPAAEIRSLASFTGPAGWLDGEDEILGDPLVRFSSGPFTIRACLFGGKESRHQTPDDFLKDFEARGENGEPPTKIGFTRIDGKKYQAYGRSYMAAIRMDPHTNERGPEERIEDEFVVVPVPGGKRFFVLTLKTTKGPVYEPGKRGTIAWVAFLKSFKLAKE